MKVTINHSVSMIWIAALGMSFAIVFARLTSFFQVFPLSNDDELIMFWFSAYFALPVVFVFGIPTSITCMVIVKRVRSGQHCSWYLFSCSAIIVALSLITVISAVLSNDWHWLSFLVPMYLFLATAAILPWWVVSREVSNRLSNRHENTVSISPAMIDMMYWIPVAAAYVFAFLAQR